MVGTRAGLAEWWGPPGIAPALRIQAGGTVRVLERQCEQPGRLLPALVIPLNRVCPHPTQSLYS